MDMKDPIVQQYLISAAAVAVGLAGWLLPESRWNPLRLRAAYARHVSDGVNRAIPKVLGTLLIAFGILIAVVTFIGGPMEAQP